MKKRICQLIAMGAFLACMGVSSTGLAASVQGKVTFVGTLSESVTNNQYSARFRVLVSQSSCDGGTVRDRWVHVVSGRMDGAYAHNIANTRNAYSTLMAAFLSGRNIQIDSSAFTCSSTATTTINLWSSNIGVY